MDNLKEKTEEIKKQEIETSKEQETSKETETSKEPETSTQQEAPQERKEPQKTKKQNILLKTIKTILQALIWVIIAILLIIIILATTSKKTDIFGYRIYVILTGSMEPTIHVKQAIITQETDNPQVGDIIAFGEDDFIIVHRIVKEYTEGNNKQYQTKGDNNNTEDKGLVQQSQIKGKVKYILPGVGEAILFIQSHIYLLIIAIGVSVIVILVRRLI